MGGTEDAKNPKEGQYGQSKMSKAECAEKRGVRGRACEHLETRVKSLDLYFEHIQKPLRNSKQRNTTQHFQKVILISL